MTSTAIENQHNAHGHFATGCAQQARVIKAQDVSR
jgi:hypothetical protein